jgi:hypothetical protein
MSRGTVILLTAGLVLVSACGRKGAPRPAGDVLPETITDLSASATPEGIRLSWQRPRRYTGGDRMPDLGGFWVQRADASGADFATVHTLAVTDLERFQQAKRFHYLDTTAEVGRTYQYRVVSFTVDRYVSEPSNIVAARRPPVSGDAAAPTTAAE